MKETIHNEKRTAYQLQNTGIANRTLSTLLTLLLLLAWQALLAQSTEKFNYQAVVRDASGYAVATKTVSLRISLLKGSAFGTYMYVETHKPQTNAQGVVNLVIGDGTVSSGSLSGIKWNEGPYFLKVELDASGGTSYSEMGTTQLLSVPYSLYSNTAGEVVNVDYSQLFNKPDMTIYQPSAATSNWDKDQSNDVTIEGNQTIIGMKTFSDTISATKAINLKGSSTANPLIYVENLSTSGTTNAIRAINNSSSGATVFVSSPYHGISSTATDPTIGQYGVLGSCLGIGGYGVYGYAQHATGTNSGVRGVSLSNSGYGVYGSNGATTGIGVYGKTTWTTGENIGVKGECNSPAGYAIHGKNSSTGTNACAIYGTTISTSGVAIQGESKATSGTNHGVHGIARSGYGAGVYGENTNTTGTAKGVYGTAASNSGSGVYGVAEHSTGVVSGVYGLTSSTSGKGVAGISQAETGNSMGVFGSTSSSSGVGVYGLATSSTGVNYGVKGYSTSSSGFDFYAFGAGTNYGSSSSIRWKKNIQPIANTLEKLKNLQGVYFTWDAEHGGQHDLGFIGEEVAKYFPEIVVNDPEAPGFIIGMDYSKMTPILLQAINEQQATIEAQNKLIQQLMIRVEALEKK